MLLLPMRAGSEGACGKALLTALRHLNVPASDFVIWVRLRLSNWRETGVPHPELEVVTGSVLAAADARYGANLGRRYFALHRQLCNVHFMSHEEGVAFLTHAFLFCDLATLEHLSAAQIAKVVARRDRRVDFSRQSVGTALRALLIEPRMTTAQVQRLSRADRKLELPTFADADLATSADIVAEAALGLGFLGDAKRPLQVLAPIGGLDTFAPYLQILHYQCAIAEFFDHAVTDLYEFKPRGTAARWLFAQYPAALSGAGNPFLNNAKSVERLDEQWVRSKKARERPGAEALFSLLSGMEAMGFATRREFAHWIRLWLHRIMRLAAPTAIKLPEAWQAAHVQKILQAISQGNTRTYGILEQRVVDAVAALTHIAEGWRGRGLGDSVNASNTSRRKLGDCDFQNADDLTVEAYEAHAGELTDVYVEDHLHTLERCLEGRVDELVGVADLGDWSVSVIFVAHKLSAQLPREVDIRGVRISLSGTTFEQLVNDVQLPDLVEAMNQHVLVPLRDQRTPQEVRSRVFSLTDS
jgi:hypothetical protein